MDTLKSKSYQEKPLIGDMKEVVITVTETRLSLENALGAPKSTASVSDKISHVVDREFDKIQAKIIL